MATAARQHATRWLAATIATASLAAVATYAVTPGGTSAQAPAPADPGVAAAPFSRAWTPADLRDATYIARFIDESAKPSPTATPTATVVPPSPTATLVPATATPVPVARRDTAASAPLAPPPAAPAAPQPWGLDTAPMDAFSQTLFDDTNRRRVESGLAPLRVDGWLIGIARIRAQDMAQHNYFAHVSPVTGDSAFTLMDKHGVPYGWAGENLAKNNYPDDQTVSVADNALWNSPPHRENILNPNYTDMGIALAVDPSGMKYFAIIFTGPP
ncbi:MAG TPA: CAP domain-containing protein [Dehalococcoidia bacterium]|nr:CAP domain-containing protein [Dehalococcoidia bacterium]